MQVSPQRAPASLSLPPPELLLALNGVADVTVLFAVDEALHVMSGNIAVRLAFSTILLPPTYEERGPFRSEVRMQT
ncbi:hypothetical protein BSZ35_03060 [Salinibacter sp. 10B]|nr:hypothetical protein BSZ35_03060 [Salinibacter sp. 10B]